MNRQSAAALAAILLPCLLTNSSVARAQDPNAVVDKAIKAAGGEENLAKVKAASWKAKTKLTFNGNENEISTQVTMQGLDHYRQEMEGDFGGNHVKGVMVLNGDKGSRHFGDNTQDLDKEGIANQKRAVYLTLVSINPLQLKNKDFKLESAPDATVDGKPAVGIKVTPPDRKVFTVYFDKESGLIVRIVATVAGFMGGDFTQESTFSDFKEVGGIKKAMKIVSKRDGEPFMDQQITDFKVLDTVDPKTFTDAG